MKTMKWLALTRSGRVRVTTNRPRLERDELAMCLSISVPDSLFVTPTVRASLAVTEEQAGIASIDAETVQMVQGAIEQATGLTVELQIVSPEPTSTEEGL